MTSQINSAAINENFPVAGQDNDTQVFRDNFDTIKNNFRFAQEEITDLQDNVLRSDQENDLNGSKISNAVLFNNRELILDGGGPRTSNIEIDFESSPYQIYRVGANLSLVFQGLPGDTTDPMGVGKLTVELYGDGTARTVTLDPSGGVNYRRINWPSNAPSPTSFIVQSNVNPVIIELWRYSDTAVFVEYLGNFLPSGGGGTTDVAGLNDIGNVDVSSATNGNVLQFDSSTQQWKAQDITVSEVNALGDIPDVEISSPTDQQVLKYNASTQSWINSSAISSIVDIDEIGNVIITTPLNGQVLKYNGINWVNSTDSTVPTIGLNDLTNVNFTNPQNNDILQFSEGQWIRRNLSGINDLLDVKFTGTPNNGQILKYVSSASGWVNVDSEYFTGSQNLTSGSAADLTRSVTYFSTTTASTGTLAAGTEGLAKTFIMVSASGNMVITVTNPGWTGTGIITFSTQGQACTLQYINSKWYCIGNNGATFS